MSMLRITHRKGFGITFANGWTASVQWGPRNYCDNYDRPIMGPEPENGWQSSNAEIAAISPDGEFMRLDNGDDVKGRVEADEVAAFIAMVAALPKDAQS